MGEAQDARSCASCGHALEDRYCPRCGEKRLDPAELTVRHFLVHVLAPEILSVDGRIWRTLGALLFRPARLTLEYVAGRRRRYVQPLRVLLTAVIAYALVTEGGLNITLNFGQVKLSLAPISIPRTRSVEGTLEQIDRFDVLETMFRDKIGAVESAPDEVRDRFNASLAAFATPLSFMSVVLLAVVLYACFHRRRRLFVEHAVFSMHFFSFVLLWSFIAVAGIRLRLTGSTAGGILMLMLLAVWQFVYLTIALRRFYLSIGRSRILAWATAAGVSVVVYLLNAVFITGVQLAGGAIAIWQLGGRLFA